MKLPSAVLLTICTAELLANDVALDNQRFCPQSCRLPMMTLGQHEYYFHIYSKMTWNEAFNWCQANRLQLVSIETEQEDKLIHRVVSGYADVFWTSGNDLENEGTYVWRSTGKNFTYTGWTGSEPQNMNDHEHCVLLGRWAGGDERGWLDIPCMWKHFFICEKYSSD